MLKTLRGYKTYFFGGALMLSAVAGFLFSLSGDDRGIELHDAVEMFLTGATAMGLRAAIAKGE